MDGAPHKMMVVLSLSDLLDALRPQEKPWEGMSSEPQTAAGRLTALLQAHGQI